MLPPASTEILETEMLGGTEKVGGYNDPLTDETVSSGVETKVADVRDDTERFAGTEKAGG